MPSDECHIHFQGVNEIQNILAQDLEITVNDEGDPRGAMRVRAVAHVGPGVYLPSDGWEDVPGTTPTLQARADAHYTAGYIRIRLA